MARGAAGTRVLDASARSGYERSTTGSGDIHSKTARDVRGVKTAARNFLEVRACVWVRLKVRYCGFAPAAFEEGKGVCGLG